MDAFWGGVTGWFRVVECKWKTDGGMGLLVGGESKLGSTEHDPVDDGDMTKFQLHSHVQSITSTTTNGLPTHWRNIGDIVDDIE